ncbi:hypothetical protein BC831DRAFT_456573 [Entophlyctis helioformis]|nr:hypothetical protein BC831DRAFT_456573 [Entophlyctis helioformis]
MLARNASPGQTQPPGKLFQKKTNKAKKGINALILTSGALASIGCPSYFSFLSFKGAKLDPVRTAVAGTNHANGEKSRATPLGLSAGLAASRRVASMSVLSSSTSSTLASSSISPVPSPAMPRAHNMASNTRQAAATFVGANTIAATGSSGLNHGAKDSAVRGKQEHPDTTSSQNKPSTLKTKSTVPFDASLLCGNATLQPATSNINDGDDDNDDFAAFAAECDQFESAISDAKALSTASRQPACDRRVSGTPYGLGGPSGARHPSALPGPSAAFASVQATAATPDVPVQENHTTAMWHTRRIQSAPGMAGMACPPDLLEFDDSGLDDTGFHPEDWLVPAVKSKAETRHRRGCAGGLIGGGPGPGGDTHGTGAGIGSSSRMDRDRYLEDWDTDFDLGDAADHKQQPGQAGHSNVLEIPEFVVDLQSRLKADIFNMHKFALHMQDLRLVFLDAQDIANGLAARSPTPARLAYLRDGQYAQIIDQCKVMLDLADSAEDETGAAGAHITARHIQVLGEILAGSGSKPVQGSADTSGKRIEPAGQSRALETLEAGSSAAVPAKDSKATATEPLIPPETLALVQDMVRRGVFVFGNDILAVLLSRVAPLKHALHAYVGELRQIAVTGR